MTNEETARDWWAASAYAVKHEGAVASLTRLLSAAEARGRAAERAAVVTWLEWHQDEPHPIEAGEDLFSPECRGVIAECRHTIERGEHACSGTGRAGGG